MSPVIRTCAVCGKRGWSDQECCAGRPLPEKVDWQVRAEKAEAEARRWIVAWETEQKCAKKAEAQAFEAIVAQVKIEARVRELESEVRLANSQIRTYWDHFELVSGVLGAVGNDDEDEKGLLRLAQKARDRLRLLETGLEQIHAALFDKERTVIQEMIVLLRAKQ